MKLIVFDLDGTLVNSLADLAAATNISLKKFGYPEHELEKFRYFVGDGVPKLLERAVPESERSAERLAEMKKCFDAYYNTHFADNTNPYDGIPQLLVEIKKLGYKMAVASNKPDEFTKEIVNTFFEGVFDIIQGKAPDTEKKPAPDIVLKIMKKLNASAEDTVMVGDSNVDIFTAKNAGIKSIGCLWGFRTRQELEEAGADYIAEKPSDILDHI